MTVGQADDSARNSWHSSAVRHVGDILQELVVISPAATLICYCLMTLHSDDAAPALITANQVHFLCTAVTELNTLHNTLILTKQVHSVSTAAQASPYLHSLTELQEDLPHCCFWQWQSACCCCLDETGKITSRGVLHHNAQLVACSRLIITEGDWWALCSRVERYIVADMLMLCRDPSTVFSIL